MSADEEKAYQVAYQAAIDALIRKHQLAVNELTEKQLAEAIRQACACGDFQRHVCASNSSQVVIYVPHAREVYLIGRIRELEERLQQLEEDDHPDHDEN